MRRLLLLGLFLFIGPVANLLSDEPKTRILLLGKDRDHAFGTHEYMSECALLAACLRQTKGIETVVSNGWPKDAAQVKNIKAIVLYTANGGDVLFNPLIRAQVEGLLKNGVGLTAIHWSTGASKKTSEPWLNALGGWFNTDFSRYTVKTTKLKQLAADHPICRGWKEYDLKDEYYLQLKFLPDIKPILQVEIDKKDHTVAWVYERPESKSGRSFGCVCGHFHNNFGEKEFRQALVNGILWTAHVEVPASGAPVSITAKDMELPPDPRKKKEK
jgi:type 1 glutamine amidotransferase